MTSGLLSLDEAVAAFLDDRPASVKGNRSYRATLGALQAAYPGHPLNAFEPPGGQKRVAAVLADRWSKRAPDTYRRNLSLLRTFFEWHRAAGNLTGNPTNGLTYPTIKRQPRRTITRAETETLLEKNPEPRDQVPLRLLLTLGIQKETLRHLRFCDFDSEARTVTYERRGLTQRPVIEDDDFWAALQTLRDQRRAAPDEYLLPAERSRKRVMTPDDFAAAKRDGVVDGGRRYLWQKYDGTWWRTTMNPTVIRDDHGTHTWWYRCLWRASLVTPGVTSGFRMQSARYTFGRRQYTRVGHIGKVERELGLGPGGSTGYTYRNQDADLLDTAIRRVSRRLRLTRREKTAAAPVDGRRVPAMWWKEPVRDFAQYVGDERNLIELSRVSVEMLRLEDGTSSDLHDAAETLTRAVPAAALIERAEEEARDDHPLLHGHSLVAIWSALEAMVYGIVDTWLLWWGPSRAHVEGMFPAINFATMDAEDRAVAAREALDGKHRSRRRLEHFEWLFDGIKLTRDDNDERMVENLFEMQQVRNVFAHRRGIADTRLLNNCPHLPFREGEQLRVDRNAWSDFLVTTVVYADSLTRRMKRELGLSDWQRPIEAPEIRYPL